LKLGFAAAGGDAAGAPPGPIAVGPAGGAAAGVGAGVGAAGAPGLAAPGWFIMSIVPLNLGAAAPLMLNPHLVQVVAVSAFLVPQFGQNKRASEDEGNPGMLSYLDTLHARPPGSQALRDPG
jgi:hypothetical protein